MRTVKVTADVAVDATTRFIFETEEIVSDDEDPRDAGVNAAQFLNRFIEGYGEGK